MIDITAHAQGAILAVLAHPGSKRTAVIGERAGSVRVAVSAVAEKGKANAAIERVRADGLRCKLAQVQLVKGGTSRQKRFLIVGLSVPELRERLA